MTRRRIWTAAIVAALAGGAWSAQAQTAQQIIERHVKALGGAKALRAVTSFRLSGTIDGGGEFLWQSRTPSAYYFELRRGDTQAVEAFNGKSAWREDDTAGLRTLTGREHARARAEGAYRNDHLLSSEKERTRISLLGRDTVDGRAVQAVALTAESGIRRKLFFDTQTYLVLKEERQLEGDTEELLFGDYRAVDGVQEPHRIRISRRGDTFELRVLDAAHNVRLETTLFDYPRRDGAPLPDVATLLEQLEDNQKTLEKARADYTYTKTQTDVAMDAAGRPQDKSERTYQVFHLGGHPVEKLVSKDGKPLADAEARREQERVEKVIRGHEDSERKRTEKKAKRKEADDDEPTISEILRVCQLVNPRRERFRGREVVVVDFEPRPGEKARSRAESWVQKVSGNIWIDEHAKQVVRADVRVNDPIKIGGGLVLSLQRGATFAFEQELVNGEIWLPSYAEVNASARLLLVKGFKINQRVRFGEYKKFEVETFSAIHQPKP